MKKNMLTKGMEMAKSIVKDITEYDAAVKEASSAFWSKHKALGIGLLIGATAVELYSNGTFDAVKKKIKKSQTFKVCEIVRENDWRLSKYAKGFLKSNHKTCFTSFEESVKCRQHGDEFYKTMTYDNCCNFNKYVTVGTTIMVIEKTNAYALVEIDHYDRKPYDISSIDIYLLIPTTTGSTNK